MGRLDSWAAKWRMPNKPVRFIYEWMSASWKDEHISTSESTWKVWVCVCVCVHSCTHASVCLSEGQWKTWSVTSLVFFVMFCFEVESFIGNSPNRWSWLTRRTQGSTCLPPSLIVAFGDVYCSTKLLCGFWRPELRSLCWHSKHFSHWIFSSAAPLFFLERRSHCIDQTSFGVSLFVPRLWRAETIGVHYYTLYIPFFIFLKNMCSWLSPKREPLLQGVL